MLAFFNIHGYFSWQKIYKKREASLLLLYGFRQRPTLPGRVQPSTIGAEGLNFCVRYGNRWDPFAIITGNCELFLSSHPDNCTAFLI